MKRVAYWRRQSAHTIKVLPDMIEGIIAVISVLAAAASFYSGVGIPLITQRMIMIVIECSTPPTAIRNIEGKPLCDVTAQKKIRENRGVGS